MSLVNQPAPTFELEGVVQGEFQTIKLADFIGEWLIVMFYPLDFTFVCPTELRAFSKRVKEFADLKARVVAISVDSKYTHLAWQKAELGDINFPMLSDLNKRVSRSYGVLLEDEGVALRGLFIIDRDGKVRYQVVHGLEIGRSVDETKRVLQALQTGNLCPVDWEPGQPDLGKA